MERMHVHKKGDGPKDQGWLIPPPMGTVPRACEIAAHGPQTAQLCSYTVMANGGVPMQQQGQEKPTLQKKGVAMNGQNPTGTIQRKILFEDEKSGDVNALRKAIGGNPDLQKIISLWVKDEENRTFSDVAEAKAALESAFQIHTNAQQIHKNNQQMIANLTAIHDQSQSQQSGYTYNTRLLEHVTRMNLLASMLRQDWKWTPGFYQHIIDLDGAIIHVIHQLLGSFGMINPQTFDAPPQAPYAMVAWGDDTIQHLSGSMARLDDPIRRTRFDEIANLRGHDDEGPFQPDEKAHSQHYKGAIPYSFIASSRSALLHLVEQVGDSVAIFSLERGGALLADHLVDLLDQVHHASIHNVKVPKSSGRHTSMAEVKEEAPRIHASSASSAAVSRLVPRARKGVSFAGMGAEIESEYTRERHHRALASKMMNFEEGIMFRRMLRSDQVDLIPPEITISLAETAVSGASVNTLLSTLVQYHALFPQSRFRVLVEKQTIKEEGLEKAPKGGLRTHDPGIHPGNSLTVDSIGKIEMFIAHARYILGEDVGYQVSYHSRLAGQPIVIFDESTGRLIAVKLSQDTMLPRDILRRLILGEFDRLLADVLGGGGLI
jgi:hypothetical protein